jgi:hypothetical protein
MRAIDKTTKLFVASVKEAVPEARVRVQRSVTKHGRSSYVYIQTADACWPIKVRISDHAVGMRRALYGGEDMFMHHLAKPASWAVWVSNLPKRLNGQSADKP